MKSSSSKHEKRTYSIMARQKKSTNESGCETAADILVIFSDAKIAAFCMATSFCTPLCVFVLVLLVSEFVLLALPLLLLLILMRFGEEETGVGEGVVQANVTTGW